MTRTPLMMPNLDKPLMPQATPSWFRLSLVGSCLTNVWRRNERLRSRRPPNNYARSYGVTRERKDEFVTRLHRLTAKIWDDRFYTAKVMAVPSGHLARDKSIHLDTTPETLVGLKTVLPQGKDGRITASNASPFNDGTSTVLTRIRQRCHMETLPPVIGLCIPCVLPLPTNPNTSTTSPGETANRTLARVGINHGRTCRWVELN